MSRRSSTLARRFPWWGPFAIAVLSIVVALGGTLPAYARLAAGPKAHVCHCETGRGHAHCECPICFPELESDLGSVLATIKGRCGDDDTGWRTLADPAVVPAVEIALLPAEVMLLETPLLERQVLRFEPPEPRPPRASVS